MMGEHDSFHIGAKALVFNEAGEVLLLQRDHADKYWDLPGGRVQKDESVNQALLRELGEEIGLEGVSELHSFGMFLTDFRIPAREESVGLIFSIFKCVVSNTFCPVLSKEHTHFEWLDRLQACDRLKGEYPPEFIEKLKFSAIY